MTVLAAALAWAPLVAAVLGAVYVFVRMDPAAAPDTFGPLPRTRPAPDTTHAEPATIPDLSAAEWRTAA